jgi:NAD(P)-dependent dehydrogenase (short-subunit alcohol dehydrogenase family)
VGVGAEGAVAGMHPGGASYPDLAGRVAVVTGGSRGIGGRRPLAGAACRRGLRAPAAVSRTYRHIIHMQHHHLRRIASVDTVS